MSALTREEIAALEAEVREQSEAGHTRVRRAIDPQTSN